MMNVFGVLATLVAIGTGMTGAMVANQHQPDQIVPPRTPTVIDTQGPLPVFPVDGIWHMVIV